ncbi:MAG: cyclic nucleotide-binding domain-containing protein [Pseudomonadota bacterium]
MASAVTRSDSQIGSALSGGVTMADVRRLSPFEGLRNDNLKAVMERARSISLKSGEWAFRSGDNDKHSYFLLTGSIGLYTDDGRRVRAVEQGGPEARAELAPMKPRRLGLRAEKDTKLLVVESEFLEIMLTWDKTGSYEVSDLNSEDGAGDDWMSALLHSALFQRIPPGNIQALFLKLERRPTSAGETLVRQGDPGDYFYFVIEGSASVTRTSPHSSTGGFVLATLNPGDTFGEEALLSGRERTASVTMNTDGAVMRLSNDDFFELLCKPMLKFVDYEQAQGMVLTKDAQWLDVRLPTEVPEDSQLEGAISIPLFMIRMKSRSLDPAQKLIAVCDDGGRSTAAAYLLAERGFDVYVVKDGVAGLR